MQKCAFSCAGLANDGDHLAWVDLEVEAVKEIEDPAGGFVGFLEVVDLDDGCPQVRVPCEAGGLAGNR